jgi:hypothetical protein
MQVEEGEVLACTVEVQDDPAHCVDGGVESCGRGEVAAVEVGSVGIDAVVPAGHSVGVEDGEDVEDKAIPQQLPFCSVGSQFLDDAGGHVRAGHFPWMHSRSDDHAAFVRLKLSRLVLSRKEMFVGKVFLFVEHSLSGGDGDELHWPSLQRVNYAGPFEVYSNLLPTLLLYSG